LLDESSVTGEPMPVHCYAGDAVSSGTTNAGVPFDLMLSKTAADST
jgi:cation transport ATPase